MAYRTIFSVRVSLIAAFLIVPPMAKAAQVLPAATFVEVITASPTNTGQVSGRFDDVPEIISFDETVTSNGNFVARYISEARTSSIGAPTADVQGDGVNVRAQSRATLTFEVAIAPPSGGAPTNIPIPARIVYRANVVAAIGEANSRVTASTRVFTNTGADRRLQVDCLTGGDCSTQNVTNGLIGISLVPGGSAVRITKEAVGNIGSIFPGGAGTGSFQAVVDPIVEINPDHMVNLPGQGFVRSADVYELVYSPGIVIPEPSTVMLALVVLFGLVASRSPRRP